VDLREETRKLSTDCVALELSDLNLRLDVLDSNAGMGSSRTESAMTARAEGIDAKFDEAERRASEAHAQTMRVLDLLADARNLRERAARLEVCEQTRSRG
jgi:hypothetical protein